MWCLFSLLLIGGAVDLETSDYARVANIFYRLALRVSAAQYYFYCLCFLFIEVLQVHFLLWMTNILSWLWPVSNATDTVSDASYHIQFLSMCVFQANDAGDYFPIWGTCMGMQLLTVMVAGENLLTSTAAENIAMPLNLTAGNSLMLHSLFVDMYHVSSRLTHSFTLHLII